MTPWPCGGEQAGLFFFQLSFYEEVKALAADAEPGKAASPVEPPHAYDSIYLIFRRSPQPGPRLGLARYERYRPILPGV